MSFDFSSVQYYHGSLIARCVHGICMQKVSDFGRAISPRQKLLQ